ncbi:MAG: HNH endonuclease [Deltaproteobacteria bacterium]|nr:HNH endonuclease [Deltaproteobacteria bacterium]
MARPYIPDSGREKITADAQPRCGYCLTSQLITGMPIHLEHILPLAAGGQSDEENLWLACPLCNGDKGIQTQFPDPETGEVVALFDPRQQIRSEHFRWNENGVEILGITSCGRATVVALKLNNESIIRTRRRWVLAGWHPPTS